MTAIPRAKIARLTQATHGEPVIFNLQFDAAQPRVIDVAADGSRFERVEISQEQLRNIVSDGAKMLRVTV